MGGGSSGSNPVQQAQSPTYDLQSIVSLLTGTTLNGSGKSTGKPGDLSTLASSIENLLPGYTNAINAANTSAQTAATNTGAGLYNNLASGINSTSQNLGASNLQANANALGSVLNSSAPSLINQGIVQGSQQLNPLYNAAIGAGANAIGGGQQGLGTAIGASANNGAITSGLGSLIGNINPNQFTGSQLDQISRGLAQSNQAGGNANLSGASPITSLNNAMTFGTGLQNMQSQYGNLVGQAANTQSTLGGIGSNITNTANTLGGIGSTTANTSNALNGGATAFGSATGQTTGTASPNTSVTPSNFLTSPNTTAATGASGTGLGSNILGSATGTYNSGNQAAAGQTTSSSVNGGICGCYIAMQSLGGHIPCCMRDARDIAYARRPSTGKGYRWMSLWLVPMMIHWDWFNSLVCAIMMIPLREHAGWMFGEQGCKPRIAYYQFWFNFWNITGKLL